MADPERKERHYPNLQVTRAIFGVWVDTYYREIPQRDLMTVLLNGALMTKFGLSNPGFGVEGGIGGRVGRNMVELCNFQSNFDKDNINIGLLDDFYEFGLYTSERKHLTPIFDFYEQLLKRIFEGENGKDVLSGKYSTPEQTVGMVNKILAEIEGEGFPEQVKAKILSLPSRSRSYLRGLTDEEIETTFIPRPDIDINKESEEGPQRLN